MRQYIEYNQWRQTKQCHGTDYFFLPRLEAMLWKFASKLWCPKISCRKALKPPSGNGWFKPQLALLNIMILLCYLPNYTNSSTINLPNRLIVLYGSIFLFVYECCEWSENQPQLLSCDDRWALVLDWLLRIIKIVNNSKSSRKVCK